MTRDRDQGGPRNIIAEYRNADLTVRFQRTASNKIWPMFGESPTTREVETAASGLLSLDFVAKTTEAMGKPLESEPHLIDASLIQQGLKNCIYLVRASGREFAFVMSRGQDATENTEQDFYDLSALRAGLGAEGIDPFVPKPFMLSGNEGYSGFSVEFLKDHDELGVTIDPDLISEGKLTPRFRMNAATAGARRYNKAHPVEFIQSTEESRADDLRLNSMIAARLILMNQISGGVPKEFSINAGDFMANPNSPDFDLKLITVRGGWQELPVREMLKWFATHVENATFLSRNGEYLFAPFHFFDEETFGSGLKMAQEMLKKGREKITSLPVQTKIVERDVPQTPGAVR